MSAPKPERVRSKTPPVTENTPTKEPLPELFKASLGGALRWYRSAYKDYADCVKDKMIADRSCRSWEETVDRAMDLAKGYGGLIATARELAPDLLTDDERNN